MRYKKSIYTIIRHLFCVTISVAFTTEELCTREECCLWVCYLNFHVNKIAILPVTLCLNFVKNVMDVCEFLKFL